MAQRPIASLLVDLVARTSKFIGGLRGAGRQTARFGKDLQDTSNQVRGYARTLVAVATTGALAIWINQSLAAADATAKTSDKLGVATERLIGLRHAAEQTAGVTGGTLDTALQRMVRRVSEAARGSGEAKAAIAELRLDAQALAQLSPDQQFAKIADAMQSVSTQGDRVRLAMRLFDTEGVALVNTLKIGSEGLEAFQDDAERLGIALSRIDGAKVEAANDAIDRTTKVISGVGQRIAIELAPFLEAAAIKLNTMATESDGFKEAIAQAVDLGVAGVGFLANSWRGLTVLFKTAQLGVVVLGKSLIDTANDGTKGVQRIQARISNFGALFTALGKVFQSALDSPVAALKLSVSEFVSFVIQSINQLLSRARRLAHSIGLDAIVTRISEAQRHLSGIDRQIRQTLDPGASANELRAALDNLNQTLAQTDKQAQGLEQLNLLSAGAKLTINDLSKEIDKLLTKPLPSEGVKKFADGIQRQTEAVAQQVAAQAPAQTGQGSAAATTPDREDPKTLQDRLRERLNVLRDFGVAEREQILVDFQLKQEQLRSALQQDLITKEEFALAEEELARRKETALNGITQAGNRFRLSDAQSAAGAALELANSFGDKAIALQKGISLVQSGIAIATGIARAQELGFPANIAEALRVTTLGLKVVSTIKGANRGAPRVGTPSVRSGSLGGGMSAGADDPTTNIAAERDENSQPGKLVVPDGALLDARGLAAVINEAGRQGFVFDGIQLGGASA
jgi:hypothetical protein